MSGGRRPLPSGTAQPVLGGRRRPRRASHWRQCWGRPACRCWVVRTRGAAPARTGPPATYGRTTAISYGTRLVAGGAGGAWDAHGAAPRRADPDIRIAVRCVPRRGLCDPPAFSTPGSGGAVGGAPFGHIVDKPMMRLALSTVWTTLRRSPPPPHPTTPPPPGAGRRRRRSTPDAAGVTADRWRTAAPSGAELLIRRRRHRAASCAAKAGSDHRLSLPPDRRRLHHGARAAASGRWRLEHLMPDGPFAVALPMTDDPGAPPPLLDRLDRAAGAGQQLVEMDRAASTPP